jgi:anti-sigma-K factor RskA
VSPPEATWSRIDTAIGTAPRHMSVWQNISFWRGFATASATLAAASIAALVYVVLVPAARAPMMATLSGNAGQPNFVAAVTASADSLVIAALLTNDPRTFELAYSDRRGAAALARAHSAGPADQA